MLKLMSNPIKVKWGYSPEYNVFRTDLSNFLVLSLASPLVRSGSSTVTVTTGRRVGLTSDLEVGAPDFTLFGSENSAWNDCLIYILCGCWFYLCVCLINITKALFTFIVSNFMFHGFVPLVVQFSVILICHTVVPWSGNFQYCCKIFKSIKIKYIETNFKLAEIKDRFIKATKTTFAPPLFLILLASH